MSPKQMGVKLTSARKLTQLTQKKSIQNNKKILESRIKRINSIEGVPQKISSLKNFYTKVFAYKLALEIKRTQTNLYYFDKPYSYKAIGASNKIIQIFSPTNPNFYRKSKHSKFLILKGEISFKNKRGFNYNGLSLKEVNKFIMDYKYLLKKEKVSELKPRILMWIDKLALTEKGFSVERLELLARERVTQRELMEKNIVESKRKQIQLNINKLVKEKEELERLLRFNERYGDFSDSKDLKNSIESIQTKIDSLKKNN